MCRWANETAKFCISGPWSSWACWSRVQAVKLLPQQYRAEPSGRDEILNTWRQAFIFAPANLVTTSHPPMHGFWKCFSHESVEELYYHQQYLQLYLVLSLSGRKWSATLILLHLQWWGNSLSHSLHNFFVSSKEFRLWNQLALSLPPGLFCYNSVIWGKPHHIVCLKHGRHHACFRKVWNVVECMWNNLHNVLYVVGAQSIQVLFIFKLF